MNHHHHRTHHHTLLWLRVYAFSTHTHHASAHGEQTQIAMVCAYYVPKAFFCDDMPCVKEIWLRKFGSHAHITKKVCYFPHIFIMIMRTALDDGKNRGRAGSFFAAASQKC